MIEKPRREPSLAATDSTPKPGNFPIGSPESRAAARLTLEYASDNRERIQLLSHIPWPHGPHQDHTRPHVGPWQEWADGKLFRIVYVPPEMDVEEARRILEAGSQA